MKGLLVVGLWVVAGWQAGYVLEQVTGLGVAIPVLAAFAVAGLYLGIRITRAARSANVVPRPPAADPDKRLAA